ncbi:MAG TPA: Gfo/Idh/MocA family oxidoreductase [Candidatus Deferrimicrobiaceae bacterium]|nr:Gfo/Idh/MocA family oxidoreductase [Candidatus Deferrimicrobiaceae bacterium]
MPRVGVIGVGYLGRLHVQKLASFDDVALVGVFDADAERGKAVADEFGTSFWPTSQGLLREIEAVSIAVPTTAHYRVAMEAMRAGVHVLLEKPIAATVREGRALVREAAARRLVFQIGHLERFNAAVLSAASLLKEPRFIECHRLGPFGVRGTDVDVVLDLMIHDLDLILSFVRSPVSRIHAVGVPVISPNVDIANARLTFANGSVANVTASRVSARKQRKIRIFQEDTYVSMDFVEQNIQIFRRIVPERPDASPEISGELLETEKGDALRYEIRSFIDCVRTGAPPRVSGRDGLAALELAFRILRKMKRR